MIKINNTNYDKYEININFSNFNGVRKGKKLATDVLCICVKANDNIFFTIETVYDKDWIMNLNRNDKQNISSYVIGISYEDEYGWQYLYGDQCELFVEKLDKNKYCFNFFNKVTEFDTEYIIEFSEEIYIEV